MEQFPQCRTLWHLRDRGDGKLAEIPTVVAPTLTPPPEMNPRIAGSPGNAIAGMGEEISSMADMALQASERIKKAQDDVIMLSAQNSIDADMGQAHAGLANWAPPVEQLGQQTDQLKQDTATALREKYDEKYGNRPDLMRYIAPYIAKELNSYNGKVDVKAADLTAQYSQVALTDADQRTVNAAATEPTIDGKEYLWRTQDALIDQMVHNGTIWPVQGEQAKQHLRAQTIATEVERASNPLNRPEIMQEEIDRLKEYEGKGYVQPEELARMQAHMGESLKVAQNRFDEKDVSKQGDALLASLKNDPTLKDPETQEFDHLGAVKRVDDNPNIPTKIKKYAREELEQEAGATQKLQNDKDQKMLDSLDPHVESGALTFAELTRRENLAPSEKDWIPRRVADHLLIRAAQIQRENRVQNTQERMALRQQTDYESAQLLRSLSSTPGYLQDKSELYQGDAAKLTKGDRDQLWAEKNIAGKPEYKDAIAMMNDSGLYPRTPDGDRKFADDKAMLRARVDAGKLTGAQVLEEAKRIINPQMEQQNKETVKDMLDNLWPVMRSAVTGQPVYGIKVSPKANTSSSSQTPKTRKEYFEGMKKANPGATDTEINLYLDGKGIK